MSYLSLLFFHCFLVNGFFTVFEKTIDQDKTNDRIEFTINNIRNKSGLIRIGVFSSPEGYPDKPSESYSFSKDTIKTGQLRFLMPAKQSGSFAITILDDENSNGKMDYRLGIIPREGFGFSNNPKVTGHKAPSFEQTAIKFKGGKIRISVRMVYI
jgi:uncharacterized protein (DUF2141 family)